MATEKEEVVFELKIEPSNAFTELEKFKKAIIDTKKEQKDLNDALKKGQITQDEYVKESVRLEAMLKRQQSSYNAVQKSVTGVKTQMDKLIDSNKKISKSFQDAASQINVAGVNVGSLTTRLASFANPATAAVGIVGALGAAYARSTIGAKDLEFAQNQLASATTIVTNRFAELISSTEEGEGILSKAAGAIIGGLFGLDVAIASKISANLVEKAEDLQRKEIETRGIVSDRLTENQEKLTKIAEEQTTYNDKIKLGDEIVDNLVKNQSELKAVLEDQLKVITQQLGLDKHNDQLLTAKLLKEREINKLVSDTTKKIEGQRRSNQNIIEAQDKILKKDARDRSRREVTFSDNLDGTTNIGEVSGATGKKSKFQSAIKEDELAILDSKVALNQALEKLEQDRIKFEKKSAQNRIATEEQVNIAKIKGASMVFNAALQLADEGSEAQLALALTSIGLDTASALTGGIKAAQSVPYPGNLLAMASTIAAILTNIAQAKSYIEGFESGGYTGRGSKHDIAGVVHRDEYVIPKHIVHNPIYSGHIAALEGARLRGYSDGGLAVNTMTAEINQQIATQNSMKQIIKSMPAPVIGVKEFTQVQNRVIVKEKTTRI